ncbi:MAG TPA: N-methyl-L-tryptophan oxidase [Usitatibacter sp.]|nr:N-methyl-L-tryptophan oxidase [Usitatibacter sp.]
MDAIVVGLGAVGSAAAYQLAKRGAKVLGIDRHSPPHSMGSSHGDTRITRLAIGEGAHYTPLVLRANEIWSEIESQTGEDLHVVTGMLIVSSDRRRATTHVPNFFENTLEAARGFGIAHELLDAAAIRKRFPRFAVRDNEVGYYEAGAGYLRPEACIAAQLRLAEDHGAVLHRDERVTAIEAIGERVAVVTERGRYEAAQAIVAAGPWVHEFLPPALAPHFTVTRQALFWFDVAPPVARFTPPQFPVWIWELQDASHVIYGFPAIDGPHGGVKVATEQYAQSTLPDAMAREVSEAEVRRMHEELVAPCFPDILPRCVKAAACLYTATPDFHFAIGRHPGLPAAILASPCSGHGFKHSAAVGEALAELALQGSSRLDMSAFGLARFRNNSGSAAPASD